MRPLASVLCAGSGTYGLDGVKRMRERPIEDLVRALKQVGECTLVTVGTPVQY